MSSFDFRKMAADARAAMAERQSERESPPKKAQAERELFVSIAIKPLKEGVLPLLEKASKDFQEEGIFSTITTDFEADGRAERDPMIKFQCKGAPRAPDGYEFEARAVFFTSNGNRIRLGVGDHKFSRNADRIIAEDKADNFASLVRIGLERAIDFYMEEYENSSQLKGR